MSRAHVSVTKAINQILHVANGILAGCFDFPRYQAATATPEYVLNLGCKAGSTAKLTQEMLASAEKQARQASRVVSIS